LGVLLILLLYRINEADLEAISVELKPIMEAEGIEPSDFIGVMMLNIIPAYHAAVQEAIVRDPDAIFLYDTLFFGILPSLLGAPGQKPKGAICLGICPLVIHSIDTSPPFRTGSIFDTSPEGRRRNAVLNAADLEILRPMLNYLNKILKQLDARATPLVAIDAMYSHSDITLQLCPQSIEYPLSDQPLGLRYTGGLPRRAAVASEAAGLPSWWSDVAVNSEKKRIVAVSQGSVVIDPSILIIPAMAGLASLDSVLVVVALGQKGASLPAGTVIPVNVRVADWIPFDDLLSYSDVFITNGGYGSFQNAVARGVPLIVAPIMFAEKTDIAERIRWAGVGVNIGVGNVTPERVREAVEEIFEEPKYMERVLEVKREIEGYDPMAVVARAIEDLAGGLEIVSSCV
jgi:UDP:flavonoid glycosyltransferase YjiC (YdhE family)